MFMKIMTVAFAAVILASCGKETPVEIEDAEIVAANIYAIASDAVVMTLEN